MQRNHQTRHRRTHPAAASSAEFWRDPVIPYAESRRACNSRACYKPHSHPTFSIGAVDEGNSLFSGADGGPTLLRAGTVIFIPANRVHACNPEPNKAWSYQMLHLDAAWLGAVREEYAKHDAKDGKPEPVRIMETPAIYAAFCRLNAVLFSQAAPQDKEAALIEFVGHCDTARGLCLDMPPDASRLSRRIEKVLEFLRDEPVASVSLPALARQAGMSRYQLIRSFRAITGMTPHAWQLNQRINQARERIRAGDGIAEIAYGLGFADQAHFQRVFKSYTGITPGRFRA